MARFVLLATHEREKDECESDSASFWTYFYFTGWGKCDLQKTTLAGKCLGVSSGNYLKPPGRSLHSETDTWIPNLAQSVASTHRVRALEDGSNQTAPEKSAQNAAISA